MAGRQRIDNIYSHSISTGELFVDGVRIKVGPEYYLDPVNGDDGNNGRSWDKAFKTFTVAEDALPANKNAVLYYLSSTSGITLSAGVDWDKSYTHLIGVGAPTGVANRARFFAAAGDNGISPLFKVSGQGCIFQNLYWFLGVDDAHALICFQVTGQRNYFEDCHFAGGGHASNAIDGCASLNLVGTVAGGGSENRFVRCTIGVDTIGAATGVDALLISGTGAARNKFEDCEFALWASNAGAAFVELAAIDSIDRYTLFKYCTFINLGTSMTSGVVVPAGFDTTNKRLFMQRCMGFGVTKWDANDRDILFGDMGAVTGADLSGVAVSLRA